MSIRIVWRTTGKSNRCTRKPRNIAKLRFVALQSSIPGASTKFLGKTRYSSPDRDPTGVGRT
jgi:hypothetical protein